MTTATELVISLPRQSEKAIYEECCALLKAYQFAVYRIAQPRKTMQTPGLPDLYAMHALRGVVWIECKTDIGRQTPNQRAFQAQCKDADIAYIVGGVPEVAEWLRCGRILPWPRPKS